MKKLLFALALLILLPTCKKDVCDDIVCQNGGECLNGLCSCPDGYEGPACEKQVAPSEIYIETASLRVSNYPVVDSNGGGWDLLSGADMYFIIENDGNIIYSHSPYSEDVNGSEVIFNHPRISIANPSGWTSIKIMDFDSLDPDDLMGNLDVILYYDDNGFPTMFSSNDIGITIEFQMGYNFE